MTPPATLRTLIAQEHLTLPGEGTPTADGAGGTVAPGGANGPNGGAAAPGGGLSSQFVVMMFLVLGALLVFSLLGTRRDKKKREDLLGSIKKHDKVQTIGGMIGSITEVKKDVVVLKVDESNNTRITLARTAIQQVLDSGHDSVVGGDTRDEK
ncbi:MAG: preprotein translocase subunit YajC [Planctomycetota bacterium]